MRAQTFRWGALTGQGEHYSSTRTESEVPKTITLTAALERRYAEAEEFRKARPEPSDPGWSEHYVAYWTRMADLYREAQALLRVSADSLVWSALYDAEQRALARAAECAR